MELSIIHGLLVILFLTLTIAILFRRLALPVILGYILVGMIVGPYNFNWVDTSIIQSFSEFGIVFLMFHIGLKFSLRRLWTLRIPVFVLGGLQVILTTAITTCAGLFTTMNFEQCFIIGAISAMSSTAIVMKQLADQGEANFAHSNNALGVLLFQDLAVIPMLIFIASLARPNQPNLPLVLSIELLKGTGALVFILLFGYYILRPLLRLIIAARSSELITLAVLLIALASAELTHLLGLSYSLGAFVAGIMLSETAFQHQVEIEIRPFKDVLLGVFFISIGMLVNVRTWHDTWMWISALLTALLVGKAFIIYLLSRLLKIDNFTSARTAIVLAQGSEFGFAILSLAMHHQLLPTSYTQVILSALFLSMALSPILIRYNDSIARFLLFRKRLQARQQASAQINQATHEQTVDVVICGYGRVGKQIAQILCDAKVNCLALDIHPSLKGNALQPNKRVIIADATHPSTIKAIDATTVKAVVICLDNQQAALKATQQIHAIHPQIPIIVRSRDSESIDSFLQQGATVVVPETSNTSFMLLHHVLTFSQLEIADLTEPLTTLKNVHDELAARFFELA
ncbi:MAG: monovalent cation:proton antiporter family protein [Gammaproteobacteria bacterium]